MTSTSPLPRVPTESRRERVVQILREAITSGRFQPGDRLVEGDLAKQLGTSRAPIREALRQLEHEGLIASYPYSGTEVLGISQDEIEHVLVPIRVTLERFAFSHALPLLDSGDFDHLAALIEEMAAGAEAGDADRVADADIRFHEHVVVRSGQPHSLQIWRAIQPRVRAHFRRDAPAHQDPRAVAAQHQALLDVMRSGDKQAVLDAVDEHIHDYLNPQAGSSNAE